jgi:hypothetical protein
MGIASTHDDPLTMNDHQRISTEALAVLLVPLVLSACSWHVGPGDVDRDELYQHWVHSREEDRGDTLVYRPAGSAEFPPSWFRMRYTFHEDGTVDWLWLAPNDAHQLRQGTWWFDEDDRDVIHVQQDEETLTYRILKLNRLILLLRDETATG